MNSNKPKKHGLTLEETEEAFLDENKIIFADWKHSKGEQRITLLGKTKTGKLLNITDTVRGNKIRVITARPLIGRRCRYLKPTSRSISIRIPEYLLNRLKEKANEINIPYQSLIKEYIKKGVFSS